MNRERQSSIPKYYRGYPSELKFCQSLQSANNIILNNLCKQLFLLSKRDVFFRQGFEIRGSMGAPLPEKRSGQQKKKIIMREKNPF